MEPKVPTVGGQYASSFRPLCQLPWRGRLAWCKCHWVALLVALRGDACLDLLMTTNLNMTSSSFILSKGGWGHSLGGQAWGGMSSTVSKSNIIWSRTFLQHFLPVVSGGVRSYLVLEGDKHEMPADLRKNSHRADQVCPLVNICLINCLSPPLSVCWLLLTTSSASQSHAVVHQPVHLYVLPLLFSLAVILMYLIFKFLTPRVPEVALAPGLTSSR